MLLLKKEENVRTTLICLVTVSLWKAHIPTKTCENYGICQKGLLRILWRKAWRPKQNLGFSCGLQLLCRTST